MRRAFTTREKILLVVLAFLLISVLYFKLILTPINESIAENQTKMAAEEDEILVNTALLTRMRQMQKELDEIHAAGGTLPLPAYDNSEKLLVELNGILSTARDCSLNFGKTSMLDNGYIVCRPLSLSFTTDTYAAARAILNRLEQSGNVCQISDTSLVFQNDSGDECVKVTAAITYFELGSL